MEDKEKDYGKNYGGGRPLWQWVLIYLVIGAIIYGLIYYLFLRPGSSSINY